MLISAEIRWFWRDSAPAQLEGWFRTKESHPFVAGGGDEDGRTDDYVIIPDQTELGLKKRGGPKGGVQVKSLVEARLSILGFPPFIGPTEIWTKVDVIALSIERQPLLSIKKQRWLRKFDTQGSMPVEIELDSAEHPKDKRALPPNGCNVEFTKVTVQPTKQEWWTFGFEAFGSLSNIKNSLDASACVLSLRSPPPLTGGVLMSYPRWLTEILKTLPRGP